MKKNTTDPGDTNVAAMCAGYLKSAPVRWVRGLHTTMGLSHGDMLLAMILVAYATDGSGKRHLGGPVTVPMPVIEGFVSKCCRRRIREHVQILVDAGVLENGCCSVSRRGLEVRVLHSFANTVYNTPGRFIGNLHMEAYDCSPGSVFYKAPVTAKLTAMIWGAIVHNKDFVPDAGKMFGDEAKRWAHGYPRTALMSDWLGVTDFWFRSIRKKYAGVLWDTSPVFCRADDTSCEMVFPKYFDDESFAQWKDEFFAYGEVISGLRPEVLYMDPKKRLIYMLDLVIKAYDTITDALYVSNESVGMKAADWASSRWNLDHQQLLYDWRSELLDGGAAAYGKLKGYITALYEQMENTAPVPKEYLFSDYTPAVKPALRINGEPIYGPVLFRAPTPEEANAYMKRRLSLL